MSVFANVKKEDVEKLKGYTKLEPKTIYEELRLEKNGATLILYTSKKLLVQGNKDALDKISKQLAKVGIGDYVPVKKFKKETGTIIGSDETLKGDTFGGLVVAAVKADKKIRDKLAELGVVDSKVLDDKEIGVIADKIKKIVTCKIVSLLPEEYNALNKEHNVTEILNKLHHDCATSLDPGKHVVDLYPGCKVGDVQEEKAESKYVEVAAASILAREAALKQFNFLSVRAGFAIPKGSTHVKLALMELKERGLDFNNFVKVKFANVADFL